MVQRSFFHDGYEMSLSGTCFPHSSEIRKGGDRQHSTFPGNTFLFPGVAQTIPGNKKRNDEKACHDDAFCVSFPMFPRSVYSSVHT